MWLFFFAAEVLTSNYCYLKLKFVYFTILLFIRTKSNINRLTCFWVQTLRKRSLIVQLILVNLTKLWSWSYFSNWLQKWPLPSPEVRKSGFFSWPCNTSLTSFSYSTTACPNSSKILISRLLVKEGALLSSSSKHWNWILEINGSHLTSEQR